MDNKRVDELLKQWGKAEEESAKGKGVLEIITEAEKEGAGHKICTFFHIACLLNMGAEPVRINESTEDGRYLHIVKRKDIMYSAKTLTHHKELEGYLKQGNRGQ